MRSDISGKNFVDGSKTLIQRQQSTTVAEIEALEQQRVYNDFKQRMRQEKLDRRLQQGNFDDAQDGP